MREIYGGPSDMQLKEAQAVPGQLGQYIPPTPRQQLLRRKDLLEHSLAVVNKAITALDAHPDLEEFAETLARAL